MKASVVMWDAGFRERFHAIDSFLDQTLPAEAYEVVWVDFYREVPPGVRERERKHPNLKVVTLDRTGPWQYGMCVNAGVRAATSDLLIISDGDVVVDRGFVADEIAAHAGRDRLVQYHRRYDEPTCPEQYDANLERLRRVSRLGYFPNFAGCFSIRRENFVDVNGYEEDMAFSGPSACARDAAIRFCNAGLEIRWDPAVRLFHPWHPGTEASLAVMLSAQGRIMRMRELNVTLLPNLGYERSRNRTRDDWDVTPTEGVKPKLRAMARALVLKLLH